MGKNGTGELPGREVCSSIVIAAYIMFPHFPRKCFNAKSSQTLDQAAQLHAPAGV